MLPNPASDVERRRRLGAAGDHGVAAAPGDEPGGVADGVGAGRARRDDRLVRALQAVAHRDRRARRRWPSSSARGTARPAARPSRAGRRSAPRACAGRRRRWRRSCRSGPGRRRSRQAAGLRRTPRPRRRWRTARRGRRGGPPSAARTRASGPSRRSRSTVPAVMPGPSRPVPEGVTADAARGDDAEPGDRDPAALRLHGATRACRRPGRRPGRRSRSLELLLGDLDVELLLERHHQLDEVEAVGVEVVAELGLGHDLVLGDRQHLDGALLEPAEQFLIHGWLLVLTSWAGVRACWSSISRAAEYAHRSTGQWPMPRPPSTGITAPVM